MTKKRLCWHFGTLAEVHEPQTCIRSDCPFFGDCTEQNQSSVCPYTTRVRREENIIASIIRKPYICPRCTAAVGLPL